MASRNTRGRTLAAMSFPVLGVSQCGNRGGASRAVGPTVVSRVYVARILFRIGHATIRNSVPPAFAFLSLSLATSDSLHAMYDMLFQLA
eukprot:439951-Rhodomonas_salina.4